jgi:hypothetical protein
MNLISTAKLLSDQMTFVLRRRTTYVDTLLRMQRHIRYFNESVIYKESNAYA